MQIKKTQTTKTVLILSPFGVITSGNDVD